MHGADGAQGSIAGSRPPDRTGAIPGFHARPSAGARCGRTASPIRGRSAAHSACPGRSSGMHTRPARRPPAERNPYGGRVDRARGGAHRAQAVGVHAAVVCPHLRPRCSAARLGDHARGGAALRRQADLLHAGRPPGARALPSSARRARTHVAALRTRQRFASPRSESRRRSHHSGSGGRVRRPDIRRSAVGRRPPSPVGSESGVASSSPPAAPASVPEPMRRSEVARGEDAERRAAATHGAPRCRRQHTDGGFSFGSDPRRHQELHHPVVERREAV
jgi:hypothetical protein